MHTQKKHSKYTSPARKRQKPVYRAKSKRLCQFCIKCVLCTSVFTFTLLVPSEWNLSMPQPGFWQQYSDRKAQLLPTDAKRTGQTSGSPNAAPGSDSRQTSKPIDQTKAAASKNTASGSQTGSGGTASDDPSSTHPAAQDAGSQEQKPGGSDGRTQAQSPDTNIPASGPNAPLQSKEYDAQKPAPITNTDEQTIYADGSANDEQIYYSYADNQAQFSVNDSDPLPSVTERVPQEQLLDTTTDDTAAEHFTQLSSDWNLILVNPWNPIPDGYEISLASLPNGHSIDSRCYPSLTEMMNACREAGYQPLICSSYRSQEKQESLFQERINELMAQGYSKKDAKTKAATSVARPGTSEHQAGLAVDIVDNHHQILDATQQDTPVQQWLMENSWKYGFILRYPDDKSSLTGIIYEPWHYRYVGKEAAQEIYERGICLEEYLEELS